MISLVAEVMIVRLAVSSPRLEKRIRTRIMIARDMNPPVAVVNQDYLLYLMNWFVGKRSILLRNAFRYRLIFFNDILLLRQKKQISALEVMQELFIVLLADHPAFYIVCEGWKLQSFLFHYGCSSFLGGLHLLWSLNGKLRMRFPTALDLSLHYYCLIHLKLALMLSHLQIFQFVAVEIGGTKRDNVMGQFFYLQKLVACGQLWFFYGILLLESLEKRADCFLWDFIRGNSLSFKLFEILFEASFSIFFIFLLSINCLQVSRGIDLESMPVIFNSYRFLIAQNLQIETQSGPSLFSNLQDILRLWLLFLLNHEIRFQVLCFFLLWVLRDNLQKIALILSDISSLLQLYLFLPQFSKIRGLVIIISLHFFNLIEFLLDPLEVLGSQMRVDGLIEHLPIVKRFFDGVVDSDMGCLLLFLVLVLRQAVLLLLTVLSLEVVAD